MNRGPWLNPGVIAALVLAACAHTDPPRNEAAVNEQRLEWTRIDVADGSANAYHLTRDAGGPVQFVYVPVTPERSATGLYSGGPPRKEELEPNDTRLVELWMLLRKLEADETKHTRDRAKGTGAIAWESPAGRRTFIIQMGEDLNALLAVLNRFGR